MNVFNKNMNNIFYIFALAHFKSRPRWEGYNINEILNRSSQFICVDDICLGRY